MSTDALAGGPVNTRTVPRRVMESKGRMRTAGDAIVKLLSDHPGRWWAVQEISDALGYSRTAIKYWVHRLRADGLAVRSREVNQRGRPVLWTHPRHVSTASATPSVIRVLRSTPGESLTVQQLARRVRRQISDVKDAVDQLAAADAIMASGDGWTARVEGTIYAWVLRVLTANPRPYTARELADLSGYTDRRVRQVLAMLVRLGLVTVEHGRPSRWMAR